jgi:two-component system LytT family response regulator
MAAKLLRTDREIETVIESGDARAVRDIVSQFQPHIVFLDVEMPELNGIQIADSFAGEDPVIVFVTAFSDYAARAFDVRAIDYVVKPYSDARLLEALDRAKRRVRERRLGDLASQIATLSAELKPDDADIPEVAAGDQYLQRLSLKVGDRAIVLKIAEVIWIQAEDYYVLVHSARGRHLVRTTLATLADRLDPRLFLRVHRAAIVNLDEVREVRDEGGLSLLLSDGSAVPVSRSRRDQVESILMPRLGKSSPRSAS